jgi:hypothetical protein
LAEKETPEDVCLFLLIHVACVDSEDILVKIKQSQV